ncbi:MAG: succinate dehydrogenase, cytochrome b556 subunit [Steroidobacteraceae bacterium]
MSQRPLSPHLGVYRFGYTMSLSILHRITGVVLSVGFLVLAAWLMAIAGGAESYARMNAFLGHGVIQVLLAGWLVSFVYHFANGIRHLCWDAGWGFEKPQARRSALIVVVAVVIVAAVLLYLFFVPLAVSP